MAEQPDGAGGNRVQFDQRIRITDFVPGNYYGKNTENARWYMRSFRDYCSIQQIENDLHTCIQRLKLFLRDQAREWFEGREFQTLDQLEQEFIREFGHLHSRPALLKALQEKKLVQGESLSSYLAEIKDLVHRLGLNEHAVEDAFRAGLPTKIEQAINLGQFKNFDDLYAKVQEFLETLHPFDDGDLGLFRNSTLTKLEKRLEGLKEQIEQLSNTRTSQSQPSERFYGNYWHEDPNSREVEVRYVDFRRCYICHCVGHVAKQCEMQQIGPENYYYNRAGYWNQDGM